MTLSFPIIRHISKPISSLLVRLPITPNQITTASLIFGLVGCFFMISTEFDKRLSGSLLFIIAYILDNCDGEVARLKNMASHFGEKYDTWVDWIVHTCFFTALGYGVAVENNNINWLWLGIAGSAGGTINYFIIIFSESREKTEDSSKNNNAPKNVKEYIIFIFRELFRADFCFIVLILSLADVIWILLPAGAIGAQVYWIMFLILRRKSHEK
jgi:phosphatidylglycerophosphate synthase